MSSALHTMKQTKKSKGGKRGGEEGKQRSVCKINENMLSEMKSIGYTV